MREKQKNSSPWFKEVFRCILKLCSATKTTVIGRTESLEIRQCCMLEITEVFLIF